MYKRVGELIGKLEKDQRGFTLVELMLVVVIIGILAAVIVPRITADTDMAKINADRANIKILQAAVERYHFDTGEWPENLLNLKNKPSSVSNWRGPYVDDIPAPPQGGSYVCSSDGIVSRSTNSSTNNNDDDTNNGGSHQNQNGS